MQESETLLTELMGLQKIYNEFNQMALDLRQTIGVDLCIPNCGKCCDVVPLAYRLEGIFVISHISGEGHLAEVESRAEGWLLERHSVVQTYEGPYRGYLSDRLREEFYSLMGTQCPFLNADKTCLIYSARPLICRAFGVTHVPNESNFCPRKRGINENEQRLAFAEIPKKEKELSDFFSSLPEDRRITGLLPSIIFKLLKPEKYLTYVVDNRIATAKTLGFPYQYMGWIFQSQMDGRQVALN